jgi:putative DNA primase/helicase
MQINPIGQFRDAIQAAGLFPPDDIEADGKLRRFSSNGKKADDAGWYLLHDDGIPAGSFGDWRTGIMQTWRADIGRTLTPAEEAAHRAKVEAMRREREAEETRRKSEAKAKAAAIWQKAEPAPGDHPYLTRKGIKASGAKLHNDALLIPMRADGAIHSLQFIGPDGDKRFLTGGRVKGCYFSIGNPNGAAALCIAEGFATGATIHETTGYPVAVAFNAGNVGAVAKAMHDKFPDLPLILCADDDTQTDGNPGLTAATDAARSVGGLLALPDFGIDRPAGATDFNDMAALCGQEATASAIANAKYVTDAIHQAGTDNATEGDSSGWPDPQPMTAKTEPEPYPVEALPDTVRAAVEEVAGFVKAPVPMVASSALAALSLAIQANADAKRAEKLSGPVGLFLLTIADSGERKSTCDGFFTRSIRDYEEAEAEAAKPLLKNYRAALEAWEAKRGGIKELIRQLAKGGKSTQSAERDLQSMEHDKPEEPRVPRLIFADATPEALAFSLAKKWPSGGVVSAEAGIVFGSHGMGGDSVMRNLATLNQLWDGNSLTIDRKSSESFTVRGARLTVALQVQEPTLRAFFDKSGALARGTGFLARFLVAWPESTQGYRPFTEAPENWPALAAFNRRISEILNQPVPMDDGGALVPPMLPLSPEAKAAWIEYHDAIESELASGGDLYDVRDVASKSADNAARLAALFQIFEGGGGAIGADAFDRASCITAWHLSEARRFFGELALPVELADAVRLNGWLVEYCRRERTHFVPTREAQRLGPVRDKSKLTNAIQELEELDRVRVAHEGRRKTIKVNPALIEVVL